MASFPLQAPVATVAAPRGVVASADHLATTAGIETLSRGGNAVDAAIATNAVLAVTAPHLCGLGGDLFALVHSPGVDRPVALNASGRAGSGADAARLRAEGHMTMPFQHDIRAVTVPGCVSGWLALHERFGRLSLDEILAPAIAYASDGAPASPLLIASLARNIAPRPEPGSEELLAQATAPGALVRRLGVARTLRAIASNGYEGFYGGEFGAGLLRLGAGEFSDDDLAAARAEWVEPLRIGAWGHTLWTIPPNSQGYLTLASAWIADGLSLPDEPDDARWAHVLVEASLAAGHDRPDVLFDGADGNALLDAARLRPRRDAIRDDRTAAWPAPTASGDTTYLCVVDDDRLGVSLIQSNASGFGSNLFEPSTGINLHNRGLGFSLVEDHGAEYHAGRRPPHTLSPALVTADDGALEMVLGTQGGDAQPQILLQLLARTLHHGQSPGRAIGSARWVLTGSGQGFDTWATTGHAGVEPPTVLVEAQAPTGWASGLVDRGHRVEIGHALDHGFGHAQLIRVDGHGVLHGASDPRAVIGSAAGR